jgi:amidohydrolase
MRKVVICSLIAVLTVFVVQLALPADEVLRRVQELTDRVSPEVVEWRRDFHAHPELSNREERTSRAVAERLKALGVDDIRTGVARYGIVALIRGEKAGPTVALRADMDALPVTEETGLPFASQNPGVMHACGHDAHTAILLGAAKVLSQVRDEIHGTVKLIFQPCEEGAPAGEEGGASLMVKEGVLENPDVSAIFALHVSPEIETGKLSYGLGGVMAAVDQFRVEVRGKQTHAAYPWDGVDPIVASAHIITSLQTIVSRVVDTRDPVVVTVGIVNGGTRWNIIPDFVTLEGTIRTHNKEVREKVRAAFERIVRLTAESHGATAKITFNDYGPVTWNDPDLGRLLLPTLNRVAGEGNVIEVRPEMGGEDFAYFAQKVPGFYIHLGIRNEKIGPVVQLHSPRLIVDEDALPLGVRVMTMMALDYLRSQAGEK